MEPGNKDRAGRENITFVKRLLKDEVAERSFDFHGLSIDPQDEKSLMIAIVTLAAALAFVILNCCNQTSQQPMLIVSTFALIMFTVLNVTYLSFSTPKWSLWLFAGIVLVVLSLIMPIHFVSAKFPTYWSVVKSGKIAYVVGGFIIAQILFVILYKSIFFIAVAVCIFGIAAFCFIRR